MGASAGGIRALQTFFAAVPTDTGAAFVVVVHLDPNRRSELSSILATRTSMPVIQVQDREKLHPDHVYIIPPDRRLEIVDHEIRALPFDEPRGLRSPIDQFFRSVAERLGMALPSSSAGRAATGRSAFARSRNPAASFWFRTPPKRNTLRCLAMRSRRASSTSSSHCTNSPPVLLILFASSRDRRRPICLHSTTSTSGEFSRICVCAPVTTSRDTSAPPCCAGSPRRMQVTADRRPRHLLRGVA